jgi:DNA-binding transcriptional LysR family regulator
VDLRLLEYFLAVVDHGGVTSAAKALYIAQPSLSQAIRTLERQLGVDLFDRGGRRLTLTAEGESLVATARRIGADVDQARAAVRAVRELAGGRLELAATPTLEVDPLPELAARLCRAHPGILLSVVSPGGAAQVVDEVRRGRAELGLTELPVHAATLQVRELETQEITLVLPPALAAGLPDPLPLSALTDIPLVTMDTGAPAAPATDATVAVECAHRPAVWELVRQGTGAAFLPRRLAERQIGGVVIRSLSPRIDLSVGLVCRRGPLSPAARAFLTVAGVAPPG